MSLAIRPATENDIEALARLAAENLERVNAACHGPEVMAMARRQCSPQALREQLGWKEVYVALRDGDLAGTGALANFGTGALPRWCLSNLFVRLDLHGLGVGTALVERIEASARGRNARCLEVPSSRNAVGFYARLGFAASGLPEEDELTWMAKRFGDRSPT